MPQFLHLRTGKVIESDDVARYQNRRYVQIGAITTKDVPEGSVAEVLAWVGDDPLRRTAALLVEQNGKNRSTLLKALTD